MYYTYIYKIYICYVSCAHIYKHVICNIYLIYIYSLLICIYPRQRIAAIKAECKLHRGWMRWRPICSQPK